MFVPFVYFSGCIYTGGSLISIKEAFIVSSFLHTEFCPPNKLLLLRNNLLVHENYSKGSPRISE